MQRSRLRLLASLAASMVAIPLVGCGGGGGEDGFSSPLPAGPGPSPSPSPSPSPAPSPAPAPVPVPVLPHRTYAYVGALNRLSAFRIEGTGLASPATGQGINAVALAIHPSQQFLYAILASAATVPGFVSTFSIDADTGALQLTGSGIDTELFPSSIRFHPNGSFAYVSNYLSGTISIYDVDTGTGDLSSPRTQAVGANPRAVAMDPNGAFLYFLKDDGSVQSYVVNATSGALTFASSVIVGANPRRIAVAPSGNFIYVSFPGAVSRFAVDPVTGVLSNATTVDGGTGSALRSIALDPAGRFAYVANVPNRTISAYRIDATTGLLSSEVPTTMIGEPLFHTVDPTGQVLLATDSTARKVSMFAIDQVTGALHPLGTPFDAGVNPSPIAIASFP